VVSEEAGGWLSGETDGWVKSGMGICAKEKAEARAQARWKSGCRGSSGQE